MAKSTPENREPDIYRDNLAEELRSAPKEERKEILEQAKETPEYQITRNKKIESRQNEEEIDDGLGVFIKKRTLYHGSAVPDIKKSGRFKEAVEATIGGGVYLTSKVEDAIGYARIRVGNDAYVKAGTEPIIYECSVANLKMADLRKDENVKRVLQGFISILTEKLEEYSEEKNNKNTPLGRWSILDSVVRNIKKVITNINAGKVDSGNIRDATYDQPDLFREYVKNLGYDGLIAIEGGEGGIGNHDSYVIFDAEKIKIIKEQKIKLKNK